MWWFGALGRFNFCAPRVGSFSPAFAKSAQLHSSNYCRTNNSHSCILRSGMHKHFLLHIFPSRSTLDLFSSISCRNCKAKLENNPFCVFLLRFESFFVCFSTLDTSGRTRGEELKRIKFLVEEKED